MVFFVFSLACGTVVNVHCSKWQSEPGCSALVVDVCALVPLAFVSIALPSLLPKPSSGDPASSLVADERVTAAQAALAAATEEQAQARARVGLHEKPGGPGNLRPGCLCHNVN